MTFEACGTNGAFVPLTYSKVSIPEPLVRRVESLLNANPNWGYRSPTEAMTDAIRRWVEEREAHPEKR